MPTYEITFNGRKKGALGVFYQTKVRVTAPGIKTAIEQICEAYEHQGSIRDILVNPDL